MQSSFQVVVATDGSATYAWFLYGDMDESEQYYNNQPNAVGFDAGDTKNGYNLPYGGNIFNLMTRSNFGQPGNFLFRVDQKDIQGNSYVHIYNYRHSLHELQ